jgi:hypothetical protein
MGISSVRDSGAQRTTAVRGEVPSEVLANGILMVGDIFSANAKHVNSFLLAQIAYCSLLLDK